MLAASTALISGSALAQAYQPYSPAYDASAATASDATAYQAAAVPRPAASVQPGVPVLSGGVGASDRAMIESQQQNYSLKLVYSGQGGAFLSDVNVNVYNKAGEQVLSTVTNGPILLAKLPAGTYKVTSIASGIEKSQNITVADNGLKTVQVSYPIQDDPELTAQDGTYLPKSPSPAPTYYAPVAPASGY
jgi:hypothetical protein